MDTVLRTPAGGDGMSDPITEALARAGDPAVAIDLLHQASDALRDAPERRGACMVLPSHGRLLVTGDLHDHPVHLARIIRAARLPEARDHYVVLHELIHGERLINGVDLSHRMLLRLAALVCAHPGQVVPILANHEIAQFAGYSISKGAGNSIELFDAGIEFVYQDEAGAVREAMNDFMRSWPLALRTGNGVLCAHSLPADRLLEHFDAGVMDRSLTPRDFDKPHGAAYLMTWGRGYLEQSVPMLAEQWSVDLFCLGHMSVETGLETRGDRVVVLNSDHEAGAVLPLDLAADVPGIDELPYMKIPLQSLP